LEAEGDGEERRREEEERLARAAEEVREGLVRREARRPEVRLAASMVAGRPLRGRRWRRGKRAEPTDAKRVKGD
jgi:hypothetical protein